MEYQQGLIESTRNRIYALRERIQSTLRQDFPSDTPRLLGTLLLQLVEKVSDELDSLQERANREGLSRSERLTLDRYVRLCAFSIRRLAPYLRFVEGARLEHNPWHIVGQFERLLHHIAPRARVIIRPKWKYNYESLWLNRQLREDVKLPARKVEPIFSRAPEFFALSYTSAEADDFLQYALWGHEIGHLYSQELDARNDETIEAFSRRVGDAAPFSQSEIDGLVAIRLRSQLGLQPQDLTQRQLDAYRKLVQRRLTSIRTQWLSEIFADIFAIKLFGPAPLFAFADLPFTDDELDLFTTSHPMPRLRLALMMAQVEVLGYAVLFGGRRPVSTHASTREVEREVKRAWQSWFDTLEKLTKAASLQSPKVEELLSNLDTVKYDELEHALLLDNLRKAIPVVVRRVNDEVVGEYFCSSTDSTMKDVFRQVDLLRHDLPPQVNGSDSRSLGLILTAGWLYWTTYGKPKSPVAHQELFERRKTINRLLSRGIESATIQAEFEDRQRYAPSSSSPQSSSTSASEGRSGILAAPDLWARLREDNLDRCLCVFPLLEDDQIEADTIDIRLGSTFLVTRRTSFPVIDVTAGEDDFKERLEQYQQMIYVPMGRPFYIHPGQFVLAGSLEFLSIPKDLGGTLVGRTSWSRLGISGPIASRVAPGFKGCLTIELGNSGESPVPLYPGVRIAQLRLQNLSQQVVHQSRYPVPTGPQFTRIYEDHEMSFLSGRRPPLVIGVTGVSKSGRSRVVSYLREEGFADESLVALNREERRRSGQDTSEERDQSVVEVWRREVDYVAGLRRNKGNAVLAELFLERLHKIPSDRIVVEGIERPEEVDLLTSRTHFHLIGIDAPFENRLERWNLDFASTPISEQELRTIDRMEYDGLNAEVEVAEDGTPCVRACIERARQERRHIDNSQDNSYLHDTLKAILSDIMQRENLW